MSPTLYQTAYRLLETRLELNRRYVEPRYSKEKRMGNRMSDSLGPAATAVPCASSSAVNRICTMADEGTRPCLLLFDGGGGKGGEDGNISCPYR